MYSYHKAVDTRTDSNILNLLSNWQAWLAVSANERICYDLQHLILNTIFRQGEEFEDTEKLAYDKDFEPISAHSLYEELEPISAQSLYLCARDF